MDGWPAQRHTTHDMTLPGRIDMHRRYPQTTTTTTRNTHLPSLPPSRTNDGENERKATRGIAGREDRHTDLGPEPSPPASESSTPATTASCPIKGISL